MTNQPLLTAQNLKKHFSLQAELFHASIALPAAMFMLWMELALKCLPAKCLGWWANQAAAKLLSEEC